MVSSLAPHHTLQPSEQDAAKCGVVLRGDAGAVAGQLLDALQGLWDAARASQLPLYLTAAVHPGGAAVL